MELWIRSQDKLKLTKVGYLYVNKLNASDLDNRYEIGTGGLILGIYETKERALEVLDEIQNLLKPQIKLRKGKITGCVNDTIFREPDGYDIKELSTYVYEMPKE